MARIVIILSVLIFYVTAQGDNLDKSINPGKLSGNVGKQVNNIAYKVTSLSLQFKYSIKLTDITLNQFEAIAKFTVS